ncbi:MAG: hypothetical protein G01um101470_453 [Parcubacteria group bacterium Gr01-1014_70]|nr:MAG: hypothetical protein G01um101470_453 [Parcubacteria group bacterium Gr01-1014_70]
MVTEKQSFFEKLTGAASYDEQSAEPAPDDNNNTEEPIDDPVETGTQEETGKPPEGQLTVDVYQTPTHIVVQAPMAGVRPEDVDVSINNDMITIRGKRHPKHEIDGDNYYYRELFWGPFSRAILMPSEVDSSRTEASFKNGLLTVKMAKVNKDGIQQVKIEAKEI